MNNTDIKQISKLLDDKFDNKLAPINKTLSEHGKILGSHGIAIESIGKTLKSHGKMLESHGRMLRSLKKDQSTMLAMLDGEQMKQRKKINRIEDHLGLIPQA